MTDIKLDDFQQFIVSELDKIAEKLEKNNGLFSKFLKKKSIESLYIFSKPGRGKTMLMKLFFRKLRIKEKSYFHFNEFMYQIHQNLHQIRQKKLKNYQDEIILATEKVIKKSELICFDEFQVEDIADAMLLNKIFSYIFSKNITVIFTSNAKPKNLYKNGLQREKFLEFVEKILLKNSKVIEIDNNLDYRLRHNKNIDKRYFLTNEDEKFNQIIKNFTQNKSLETNILKIWGREIKIKNSYEKIAILEFDYLTENNFSASDFKEIAKYYDLIFLKNLDQFSFEEKNEQRRFMLFIDEIYENNVALIILAKSEINNLYIDLRDKSKNHRTISRLNEIKSDYYFKNSKLNLS